MKSVFQFLLSRIPHRFVCPDCDWVYSDHGLTKDGRRKVRGDARRHRLWGCHPDLEWVGRNCNRFDLLGMRWLIRQRPVLGSQVTARVLLAEPNGARRQTR
jgi:hypothetical protein